MPSLRVLDSRCLILDSRITSYEQRVKLAISRGVRWLIEQTKEGTIVPPSPIGLYFARLWYFEELYPVIFTVSALQKVQNLYSIIYPLNV